MKEIKDFDREFLYEAVKNSKNLKALAKELGLREGAIYQIPKYNWYKEFQNKERKQEDERLIKLLESKIEEVVKKQFDSLELRVVMIQPKQE